MAVAFLGGGGSSAGNARPTYTNPAAPGQPYYDTTPDNALNENARQFDVNQNNRQQILALLQAAVSQASGTNLGGVTAPTVNVATIPGAGGASPYTPTPYDTAADTAAYTTAKQQTGEALQASLQGLRNAMQARGITGSGVEGQQTESLYASGLNALSNVSAQNAETTAGRAFTANQSAAQRAEQAREYDEGQATDVAKFNAGNNLNANEFNVTTQANKLATLVGAYKGLY